MRIFLALLLGLALGACGLSPMYAGGASSGAAQGLAAVDIPPIPGRDGWLVRNALTERMNTAGQVTPAYRLDVRLDDRIDALGVLGDDTVTRQRRILRARYQLIDLATGGILLDATAGADAGIDVVSSEYATIAAEQTALENLAQQVADRMATRIALALRDRARADAAAQ